ncbi:hypothetical protein ME7_00815 [Bartonella birtlesii LL-WM9]|uniref:Uncharacterized protein n=1 Tax=Bartonella birtlesii LL-WM9 TaxID=1094552 RepID=J1IZB0_9HYPH|nr:hypothetical protein ME7_00815 [Bartonella birtlesii LL-WM9]
MGLLKMVLKGKVSLQQKLLRVRIKGKFSGAGFWRLSWEWAVMGLFLCKIFSLGCKAVLGESFEERQCIKIVQKILPEIWNLRF